MRVILLIALIVTFQTTFSQSSYRAVSVESGGIITGRVSLEGETPPIPILPVHKDVHCCGSSTPSPRLSVGGNHGLKNAVVYLANITEGKRFEHTETVVLDQKDCHFEPHVTLLPFGGQLVIRNSDEILHNVRAYHIDDGKTIFNIAQPIKGQQTSIRPALFDRAGIYHAVCDAGHPWMSAFIVVTEHPYYAITDGDGNFILENIPPGNYKLRVWHGGVQIRDTRTSGNEVVQYIYEDPHVIAKEVNVRSKSITTVDFKVEIR